MICSAAVLPVPVTRNRRIEPTAKMANPRLYRRTLPNMSEMWPKVTSSVAVTTM